mmetsp:Transcript_47693/g.108124  ORF Transcript_47693/g.108124 Transcript_47693/m.108124 type:complete len:207 (-) Transcript_47693:3-623(-)
MEEVGGGGIPVQTTFPPESFQNRTGPDGDHRSPPSAGHRPDHAAPVAVVSAKQLLRNVGHAGVLGDDLGPWGELLRVIARDFSQNLRRYRGHGGRAQADPLIHGQHRRRPLGLGALPDEHPGSLGPPALRPGHGLQVPPLRAVLVLLQVLAVRGTVAVVLLGEHRGALGIPLQVGALVEDAQLRAPCTHDGEGLGRRAGADTELGA